MLPSEKKKSAIKCMELTEDCKRFIPDLIYLEQQVRENEIWVKNDPTRLYQSDRTTTLLD